MEDHPIASWSSEFSQWDQADHQPITKDYRISAPYRMSASALMLVSRGNRQCGFCYSIMIKCYWCLYHAVFLTIIIIKKIIPPGKVTLYSHARKDCVLWETGQQLPCEWRGPGTWRYPLSWPPCSSSHLGSADAAFTRAPGPPPPWLISQLWFLLPSVSEFSTC